MHIDAIWSEQVLGSSFDARNWKYNNPIHATMGRGIATFSNSARLTGYCGGIIEKKMAVEERFDD